MPARSALPIIISRRTGSARTVLGHAQSEWSNAALLAMWAVQGSRDFVNGKIPLPLLSIARIIALARPVEPEEAGQPVRTEFSLQDFQGIALELLIGHLFDRRHDP